MLDKLKKGSKITIKAVAPASAIPIGTPIKSKVNKDPPKANTFFSK